MNIEMRKTFCGGFVFICFSFLHLKETKSSIYSLQQRAVLNRVIQYYYIITSEITHHKHNLFCFRFKLQCLDLQGQLNVCHGNKKFSASAKTPQHSLNVFILYQFIFIIIPYKTQSAQIQFSTKKIKNKKYKHIGI